MPQREEQRIRTGLRVTSILTQFWRDENVADAMQAIEIEGWVDVLEPLTEREIRDAWAVYQRTGPRSRNGALRKPDAGALYLIAMKARGEAQAARAAELADARAEREYRESLARQALKPTAERAAEIIRQAGLSMSVGKAG